MGAMGMFDLIKLLAENDVEYVLVGGLAVALHGYQRVTMDVDVVLAMNEDNLKRFISCAKSVDLRPTVPVAVESLARADLLEQWHREKGILAFGLRGKEAQATVMDVLIKPTIPYEDLRRDAVIVHVGPYRIPVASIDHLIAMKTGTGRGKDAVDVDELRRIRDGS